jgi:sterol desaturase/sphingolipid hydroxylase (fatty acid hydroxylase superfamily)
MSRTLFESVAFVLCVVPCFIVIEACVPRVRAPIRWRAIMLACGMLALNSLLVRQISFGTPPAATATTARIILAWFAVELGAYWLHRAMHRIPLLWRVHALHHANVPLAWHQSWWIHPLDIAMFAVVASAATWLVGAPMTAAPLLLLARRAWGILLHANVRWPATLLDHVIVTPAVHHRHHREDLPAANFAGSFSILDRAFGTFRR